MLCIKNSLNHSITWSNNFTLRWNYGNSFSKYFRSKCSVIYLGKQNRSSFWYTIKHRIICIAFFCCWFISHSFNTFCLFRNISVLISKQPGKYKGSTKCNHKHKNIRNRIIQTKKNSKDTGYASSRSPQSCNRCKQCTKCTTNTSHHKWFSKAKVNTKDRRFSNSHTGT